MKWVLFLRDMAARAMHLSRKTMDLHTSRELRIMSDELKQAAEERRKEAAGETDPDRTRDTR